jgi:nitrite reductase/ring-hydroxylating ferredoxin subunit
MTSHHAPHPSDCSQCPSRRDFLREASLAVAALGLAGRVEPLAALEPLGRARHRQLARYPIPARDGAAIDAEREVILVRAGREVFAFALSCPHQNTALNALPDAGGFICPKHKSRYRPDGTFIRGRATRHMDRHRVSRDGDAIVVDLAVVYASDRQPTEWAAARITLT